METRPNEKESLEIITRMIEAAKQNFANYGIWTLLYWGYAVGVTSLLNFILLKATALAGHTFLVWTLMVPVAVGYFIIRKKEDIETGAKNQINSIVSRTWVCFMASVILFQIIFWSIPVPGNFQFVYFTPIILIMLGIAQNITGFAYKYRLLVNASFVYWAGAVLCVFPTDRSYQFLILTICMTAAMIIPGHVLKSKIRRDVR